ncbi:MAG: peptidase S8, partial [Chloroflexi bacterium]
MRKKTLAMVILLTTLMSLVGVAPVASQGPDEPFTATPLVPGSSITVDAEKEDAPAPAPPVPSFGEPVFQVRAGEAPAPGLVAEDLEAVSIIVTFDESFDASALEAASGGQVIHRYKEIFNGASMVLAGDKVDAVASMTGVTGVYLDELLQPDHGDSSFDYTNPRFIGAPSIWPGGNAGEGVVVGVLDTGIWPEHPSFADDGTYPAPPGGPYACDFGDTAWNPDDAPFTCNNKLIGAYDFLDTYKLYTGLLPGEFDSARDADGHGTHTSSTAAGNYGVEASMLGVDRGKVSGIAPRAHVIMYKVCGDAGCYSSDSAAAVEQAILDGVDVINFSISGGSDPYSDIVSQAFLHAYDAGVFVAASAGNSGPGADTVAHREPWAMTVGASTNDRTYEATVTLTDGTDTLELDGASITAGYTADVVLAADYGDGLCLTPFPAGTFSGQIVVCERGAIARVTKSYNVQQGGAGGMILYNPVLQGLSTDPHYVPSIHIENDAGAALLDFMATHTGVVGTLSGGVEAAGQGDVMAAFSSRGGPGQSLGISKPDITAPGVQILAGNTPLGVWQGDGGMGPYGEWFQAIGGTSMSSPHIAGSAALLKALHPDWTPGQIKSALMTTAWDDVVKEDGETPADPFDYGSGRVDLNKAGNPGLTISATGQDFLDHETDLWNANYPSLYVPVMPGRITVQRTVHSELSGRSWWRLSVDSPDDVHVYVPRWIRVPGNGDKTFNITVDARDVPMDEVRHATLYLKRGHKTVRFPITIVRRQPVVTLEQNCDPASFARGETTDCTITIANNSFDEATVSLVDFLPWRLRLVSGSVVGADEHWRRWLSYEGTLA